MSVATQPDLTALNRDNAQLETDAARLGIERSGQAKSVRKLARRHQYLRLARWFRTPAASFALYPFAVFVIGPLVTGVLVMVLVSLIFSGWAIAWTGFAFGLLAGAAIFAALLYHPANSLLAAAIPDAEANLRVEQARLSQTLGQLTSVNERLQNLLIQRRELATADKLQRAMLLQRNWKTMRGTEWEDFIVEVCRTLGANVQRIPNAGAEARRASTPKSGPRGNMPHVEHTLIVTFSPRRVAVAAITGIQPFHTAAAQQLVGELAQHSCDALGIFTNTRLTAGGKQLAAARHCTLIGEDEFPDFVLGKISL